MLLFEPYCHLTLFRGRTDGGGSRVESSRRRPWEDWWDSTEEADLQPDAARAHEAQQAVRTRAPTAPGWQHGYMTHARCLCSLGRWIPLPPLFTLIHKITHANYIVYKDEKLSLLPGSIVSHKEMVLQNKAIYYVLCDWFLLIFMR